MGFNQLRSRIFSKNTLQVVFLSGCDSGLGFSLARRLKNENAVVVAGCLDQHGKGAQQLVKDGVTVFPLDVTKKDTIQLAANFVQELVSNDNYKLQAVVNNAGTMVFGEFEWQTSRLVERQVEVNLLGYFNIAHAFLPQLRKDNGRLINIVSHCALAGLPGLSIYGATKSGILNWSDTLRIEQSKYGVKVVSVIPGSFFGESNIMSKQGDFAKEMEMNMNSDQWQWHREYFQAFMNYLSHLPKSDTPKSIKDEVLYKKLLHAVLSSKPKHIYKHEPFRYSLYHTIFKLCPIPIRDYFVERFVSLPQYEKHDL